MLITPEYQATLQRAHAYAGEGGWGTSGGKYAGASVVRLLKDQPEIETILDYGCGHGTLKNWVEDKGITDKKWTLYDPCLPRRSKRPVGKFDLVITTDVLEHVEETLLNNVLKDLRSFTGKFLYSEIACYFCGCIFIHGPHPGQDMHINLKAPDEWKKRLKHREMKFIESYSVVLEKVKVRYLSIQERIRDDE